MSQNQNDAVDSKARAAEFASQAQARETSLVGECFAFLRDTRKWWLAPIIALLLFVGVLVVLGGSAAAPFIYTLF